MVQEEEYRISPLKRAISVAASAALVASLGLGTFTQASQAYAAQGGAGSTEVKLILKSQTDEISNVLRDENGWPIIGTNPLTVVIDNGDGTGSVYQDGWGENNPEDGKITTGGEDPDEDTGIDVWLNDQGIPYTDKDGVVWPKEAVVTDFAGNPVVDENGFITVRTPVGDLDDPLTDDSFYTHTDDDGVEHKYIKIVDDPVTILVDNGDGTASVYEDSDGDGEIDFTTDDTGKKVFVYADDDPNNGAGILPYTDRDGNIWATTDVETDRDGKPVLDTDEDTGKQYIIPIRSGYGDGTGEDKVGENTDVTIIGKTEDGKEITVDKDGNVYEDGVDTGVDVDVDDDGKPLTDAEGNVYKKDDVERNPDGTPKLDDNGNVIPKPGAEPIGNTGATDNSHADDNLSFTVPTVINFTSDSTGRLTGPSSEKTYIENASKFGIHISSMWFQGNSNFEFVEDVRTMGETRNIVDFKIGPVDYTLNASDYLTKKAVTNQTHWSMTPTKESETTDRVFLHTEGDVANLDSTVHTNDTLGIIQWYVSTGEKN